jgi:PTH1 family peptidyl-tRNA hydrolase
MKLIVGLGNPWKEYRETRHNVGFLFVDDLASQMDAPEWKKWYQWLYTACTLNNTKCVLLKPETYMNLSGKSVQACASFFKIAPKDIILITDDIDMDFWKSELSWNRKRWWTQWYSLLLSNHSGHFRIYKRIKVGIGRHPTMEAADWVLSKVFQRRTRTTRRCVYRSGEKTPCIDINKTIIPLVPM